MLLIGVLCLQNIKVKSIVTGALFFFLLFSYNSVIEVIVWQGRLL